MKTNIYRCPHCKQLTPRNSKKAWITSYCEKKDRHARLILVKKEGK